MEMLYGEHEYSLDEKNRLRFPAKLKSMIGTGMPRITIGRDKCLLIFPDETCENLMGKIKNLQNTEEVRRALKLFMGKMESIEEDKQGRFVLSSRLREHANITKEVVFYGANDKIELWSKEEWDRMTNLTNEQVNESLAVLSELGI